MANQVSRLLQGNIKKIKAKIAVAAASSGRKPQDITLIGVTKNVAPSIISQAVTAGITHIGENRVQEAVSKRTSLSGLQHRVTWHMIGKLQENKITKALNLFDIIHSLDSLKLAEAIARRATRQVKVLLEVNVTEEQSKVGFTQKEIAGAFRQLRRLPELQVLGLMTMAPITKNPEDIRLVFRKLSELKDGLGLKELSMGMSNDFEIAVQEGATMVRIGRALFTGRIC